MAQLIKRDSCAESVYSTILSPSASEDILDKVFSISVWKNPFRVDAPCCAKFSLCSKFPLSQFPKANLPTCVFVLSLGYFALAVDGSPNRKTVVTDVSPFESQKFARTYANQNSKTVGMNERILNSFATIDTQIRCKQSRRVMWRKNSLARALRSCRNCKPLNKQVGASRPATIFHKGHTASLEIC